MQILPLSIRTLQKRIKIKAKGHNLLTKFLCVFYYFSQLPTKICQNSKKVVDKGKKLEYNVREPNYYLKGEKNMKKLLVMLLAVAMVLSMTFALASCGGDDTSDASSKPAEESKVTSTEDSAASSDDDVTSEDSVASSEDSAASSEDSAASSEDSGDSSDEPASSEEPSVDDPSEVPGDINYITTPTKTNYALGKTYTLTRDGTDTDPNYLFLNYDKGDYSWSDADLKKMTDGVVGDITNEEYEGTMCGLTNVSVMLVGTNKLFEYIIDLGDYYGDINSIKFRNVRHGTPNGNNRGFKLRLAYVSDNGVDNWVKLDGNMSQTAVAGAPEIKSNKDEGVVNVEHFDFTYTLNKAAQGKFVRIILVSDGGYVIQLEEIEIWN